MGYSTWIRFEDPYEITGDGSGGYALLNRDKGNIVSLNRVRFHKHEEEIWISFKKDKNPFYVSGKTPRPSKAKSSEFFRLFADHCEKVEPSFIKDWDRYFDTVARVNPVKLKESAFPLTLDEMTDMFKSVAMGVEVEEAKLQPTMMAFLKDLEHMFQALPVKAFHPQVLKKELESAVDSPDLNKALRVEEHQTRHRLLCCVVATSGIAFFLKLFSGSGQPSAMESAAASLLESLSPFIGHLTRDALLKFFKARCALRTSVFRTPLDQLSKDLIKSDPFSTSLFCPKAVAKVVKTFGEIRDRSVTWTNLLIKKSGGAATSGQQARGKRKRKNKKGPTYPTRGGQPAFRGRGQQPFRGHSSGGGYSAPQQDYQQPFRGRGGRGGQGRGKRGKGASNATQ